MESESAAKGQGGERPGDRGLRHRANRRRAGEKQWPGDGLAALLGGFLDHAGGDLAELLVAGRGRGLGFGLLLPPH